MDKSINNKDQKMDKNDEKEMPEVIKKAENADGDKNTEKTHADKEKINQSNENNTKNDQNTNADGQKDVKNGQNDLKNDKKSDADELKLTAGPTHNKNNLNTLAMVLSCVAIVMSGASAVFSYLSYDKASTPLTILNSGADGNTASFVEGSVADIVEKVSSSVVAIETSTTTKSYFFGQDYTSSAAGTGVIVSEDGYILTNKHVIEGATTINVILDDGTTYEKVEVAAVDPLNDIAFLKIKDVSQLAAATLGDSKTITVGQQVIAIGNALGEYQNSVTSGIVSGTGRSLTASDSTGTMSEKLSDMSQTDAAINSGNSGGPLVNAAGEVIGINTATSSSAENVGFAIPIASVKGMLAQLKESGEASRSYIGVYTTSITADVAKEYNLPVNEGVYLINTTAYSAIVKGSPAEKAGLKDKDIITAVNGVKIGAAGSLSTLLGEYKPGDTVQLTVVREGKEIAVNVTLGAYKE
ncbi:trypsin-like peptidase domain-containing protein [Candidatus Saccharibacteria bacterium]|nr:trypsin-like peptidase domain-containing protein [Candidatus Saccharibacteria bacterium]